MANGHIQVHDPFSASGDPQSPTDAGTTDDSVEFRILMAYAKRRRPKKTKVTKSPTQDKPTEQNGGTHANGSASLPLTPEKTETQVVEEKKKRKKKMGLKHLRRVLSCISPPKEDARATQTIEQHPEDSFYDCETDIVEDGVREKEEEEEEEKEKDELETVASRLTNIANEISFEPPELESDAPTDADVEKVIGLILRETGDRLNDEELSKCMRAMNLFWDYNFFKKVIKGFLLKMGLLSPHPEDLGPQASPKTQMAVTCELTARLSVSDTLPSTQMLRHGARYLQENYASWIQQQGGYEAAFEGDEDTKDQDEEEVQ